MASAKTKLTELGTAVGLVDDPGAPFPEALEHLKIPGIAEEVWRPVVLGAAAGTGNGRDLLLRAVANGRAFRQTVLDGRPASHVEWSGSHRSTWVSDIPRDLTVDDVYFIQAKYDSRCVLNTSPANLVDELLAEDDSSTRGSWYEEVALNELAAYYAHVRRRMPEQRGNLLAAGADATGDVGLPEDVRDLDRTRRQALRTFLGSAPADPATDAAYAELCAAVSSETARRWQRRLRNASPARRTQMLFRMLRIAGGPYWLLGTKGSRPVQLSVIDTRTWREHFELRRFDVSAGRAGQPQVQWRAVVRDVRTDEQTPIEGHCEIRWSHGKFSGNPECKVQVTTPLDEIAGYEPLRS